MTWQDIETAPKDGSWFIGYWPENPTQAERCLVTQWLDWTYDGPRFVDIADNQNEQPTHWMPLPDPPEVQP